MTIRSTHGAEGLSNRMTALGIFLLSFAAFSWLAPQSPGDAQVVTRLGLTLSIVESGRLDIDRFADRTIDKALFEGHQRCLRDALPAVDLAEAGGLKRIEQRGEQRDEVLLERAVLVLAEAERARREQLAKSIGLRVWRAMSWSVSIDGRARPFSM